MESLVLELKKSVQLLVSVRLLPGYLRSPSLKENLIAASEQDLQKRVSLPICQHWKPLKMQELI
jgi:hypothetical protein